MAWQRFSVELKGEAEPVIVQTNARDFANVVMDPGQVKALGIQFQIVHSALVRLGHPVPRDYESFLEVLEGVPEPLDEEDATALDPTSAAP